MANLKKIIYDSLMAKEKKELKETYITCAGRSDGLGAQLHSYLSVLLIAKKYKLKYVHTPFSSLEHISGEEKFYEDFFDIAKNQLNIYEFDHQLLNKKNIKHPFEIKNDENILYFTKSCHQYSDKYTDSYLEIIDDFRNNFFYKFTDKYTNYNNQDLNIGLHIRRGDVSNQVNGIRFTGNDFYVQIVDKILEIIKHLNIKVNVHIYSQGVLDDFKEFNKYNVFYHLDECLITTFYNLIESDILVMSKSSLSYCAGLLSKNVVFYQPFWHNPLSLWNIIENKNNKINFDKINFLNTLDSIKKFDMNNL